MAPPVQPDRPDEPDRAAQVQAAIEERRKRIREQNRRAQERREMDARLRVKAEALRATGEVSQPPVLPTTNVGADDIDTARRGKAKSARLKDTLRQAQALAPQDERAARAFQQVLDGAATDLTKAPPRLTPPARDEAEERKQTEEAFTRARTVLEPGAPLVNLYGQIPAQAAQTGVAIGEGLGTFASFAPGLAGLRPTGATRRQVEAYYEQAVGAPQSRAAQVVAVLTRLTGDLTMFMVPGAIAARVPTALAALRGLQSIRSARYFQLLNLERKLEKALRPATFTRRAMLDFAFGAPVDAAISAAGPEQSIAGGLAAILGPEARLPFPGGPTFGEISRSLPGRVAFEVATGEVLALGFLGGLDRLEALRGAARGRYGPPESVFPGRQLELIQMQVRMAAGEPIDEALARATMTPWDELQWALEQRGVATMLEGPDMRERIRRVRAGAGSLRGLALMRPLAGAGAGVGVGAVLDPDETGVPRPVAMATLGLSGALLASSSLKALRNRFGYVGDLFNRVGSRMVKGVEGAPFGEAAEVNQWLKHLEKNVSKDELDFSGMRAWLAEFPPGTKVRREDIARFAQDNRMRLRVQEMAEEGDEIHLDLDPDDQIDAIYEDLPSYNETLGDEWVRDHLQEIGRGNLSAENFMERIDTQLDRQVEESGLIPVGEAAEIPEMVWDNATPRERTRWLEQVTDASDEAELREALGVDDDVDLDFDTIDEIPDRQTRNEINELLEQQHQQDFIVRDDLFTERQWTRLRAAAEEAEQLAGQASDLRGAEIPQWQAQWRTTTVDKGGGSDYVEAAVYWDPADVGIIRDGLPKNLEFDTVNRSGEGPTIWVVRDGTGSVVGSGLTKEAAHASAMAELRPWLSATGGHFENWRNVYVHIRTDQRLGKIPSGFIPDEQLALLEGAPGPVKRGLFIEEIQSDYAQNARPLRVRDTSEPWRIVTQEESAPFGAVEKLVRELQAMDVKLDPLPGGYARDPTGFLTGEIASRHAITQTVGALVSDLDERVLRRYADDLPTLLDGLPLRRFGGGGTDLPGEWFLRDINEDGVHFDLAPGSAPEAFSDVMFASVSLKDAGTRVDWPRSAIPGWQQAMASAEVIRQHKLWNAPDRLAAFWKSADQWTQVGLTYALLKAVDENLPFVAWASGNQQNALYSKLMMEQAPRVKWRTVKVPGATVGDAPRYAVLVDALDEHGNLRKRLLAFPNEARNTPGDFERAALSHVENRLGFDIGQLRNEPIHSLDEVLNERAPDVWEAVGRGEVEGEFSGTDLMVGDPSHPFVYDDKLPKIALKLKKALPGWEGEIPVGRVEFEDFIESNSRYVWRDGRGQEVTREALAEPLADFEEWTQVALDRTHAAFIATGWEGSVPLPSPAQIRNTILAGDFTRHETLVPVRKLIGETGEGLQTINRHIREIRDADNALPASAELGVQETLRRQLEQMQEVKGRWEARKIALDDYYRKVLDYSEAVRMKGRFQQRLTPAEIMVPVRGEPSEDLFKRLTGINRAVVTETVNAVPGGNQAIIITPALRDFIRKHGMVLPSIAPVPFIANFGTDDDDRRSSLELLGLLVAVGVGVAAARGIPIGVARARAFSRQLGERGIVSFGREIATALPHRTVEQEIGRLVELGRADVAANLDRFMQGSEARTVVFRGDNRGALFGNRLVKSRADVPGFYFTEDAEIASNYALNKPDHNVDTAYERWYEIPVLRTKAGRPDKRLAQPNLDRAWWFLTPEQREGLKDTLLRAYDDEMGGGIRFGDLGDSIVGGAEGWSHFVREAKGNWLKAAKEVWLNSAALFDREEEFAKLLHRAGIPFEYTSPHIESPAVTPMWLNVRKPITAARPPEDFVQAIRSAAETSRSREPASLWLLGPHEVGFRTWAKMFLEDAAKGGMPWWATAMHPKAVKIAQGLGYDGILDIGGKFGGREHRTWIIFEPGQAKSAIGNSGSFSAPYSITDQGPQRTMRATAERAAPIEASPGARANFQDQPFETIQLRKPVGEHTTEELMAMRRDIVRSVAKYDEIRASGELYIGNLDAANFDLQVVDRLLAEREVVGAATTRALPEQPGVVQVPTRPAPPSQAVRAEVPRLFDTKGQATVEALTVTTATGVSALVGAASQPEEPIVGAAKGALVGLSIGLGLVAASKEMARRTRPPQIDPGQEAAVLRVLDEVRGEQGLNLDRPLFRPPQAVLPIPVENGMRQVARLVADIDPDEFVNVAKFGLNPSGEDRLRREVTRLVEQGVIPEKQVITNEETRRLAKRIGLDPEDVLELPDDRRLTGAEMLAIRNIVSSNIAAQERLALRLAKAAAPERVGNVLSDAEREATEMVMAAMDQQNSALLAKFTVARSETGRDLQNMKIIAHQSQDPVLWLAKAQKLLGDLPLTGDIQSDIVRFLDQGDIPGLIAFLQTLRTSSPAEKLATLWKAGLLTSPTTHFANIIGNTVMLGMETVKDYPAFMADRMLRVLTGLETKAFLGPGRLTAASVEGAREGWREAKLAMEGIPMDQALAKVDLYREVNFDNYFLDVYTKSVFRSLTAMDRIFFNLSAARSLAEQAELMARQNPLKTAREWMAHPSDEMVMQAIHDGQVATFTNRGMLGSIAQGAKRAAQQQRLRIGGITIPGQVYAGYLMEGVMPFTRTPANIATRIWEGTPFGLLNTTADAIRLYDHVHRLRGLKRELAERVAAERPVKRVERQVEREKLYAEKVQRQIVDRLGRMAVGAIPIYLGYSLAVEHLMSGGYPTKQSERDRWLLEGKPENAVLLDGRWRSLERISPVGNLLVFGAHLHAIGADPDLTPTEQLFQAATSMGETLTQQTFLQGVKQSIDAISGEPGAGARFGTGLIAGFVPSLIRRIAYGLDPVVRDPEGLGEAFQARLPVFTQGLPPRIDQLGLVLTRDQGLIASVFDPLSSRAPRTGIDPVIAEVIRLGVSIPRLQRIKADPETKRPAEARDEFLLRQIVWGTVLRQQLELAMESPNYDAVEEVAENLVLTLPAFQGRTKQQVAEELQREFLENRIVAVRRALRRMPLKQAIEVAGIEVPDRLLQVLRALPEVPE